MKKMMKTSGRAVAIVSAVSFVVAFLAKEGSASAACTFQQVSGCATSITTGLHQGVEYTEVTGCAPNYKIYHWNESTSSWATLPGAAVQVSRANDKLFARNGVGRVYKWNAASSSWSAPIQGPSGGYACALDIGAGHDGGAWVVECGGGAQQPIFHWDADGVWSFGNIGGVQVVDNTNAGSAYEGGYMLRSNDSMFECYLSGGCSNLSGSAVAMMNNAAKSVALHVRGQYLWKKSGSSWVQVPYSPSISIDTFSVNALRIWAVDTQGDIYRCTP